MEGKMSDQVRGPGEPVEEFTYPYKSTKIKVYVYKTRESRYLARGDVEKHGTQLGFSAGVEAASIEEAKELGLKAGKVKAEEYLSD
jgi:hypothetical protein